MTSFYLTKEFEELDGLDLVVVHWAVARSGAPPDWPSSRAIALQAHQRDSRWIRRATLEVSLDGAGPWTLHHFFDWIRWGVPQSGPAYYDGIVSRTIEHVDPIGEFTDATLVYNIGEHGWTNVVSMRIDRGSAADGNAQPPQGTSAEIVSAEWPEQPGRSVADWQRRAADSIRDGARTFSAQIFAPIGARVFYSIHLARRGGLNPMADSGVWLFRRELVL